MKAKAAVKASTPFVCDRPMDIAIGTRVGLTETASNKTKSGRRKGEGWNLEPKRLFFFTYELKVYSSTNALVPSLAMFVYARNSTMGIALITYLVGDILP